MRHTQIKRLLDCLSVTNIAVMCLFSLTIAFSSCQRRILEEEESTSVVALVPIKIDWKKSGLIDKSGLLSSELASIWVFPENGDKPFITVLQSDTRFESTLRLPIGVYSILIFNEEISSPLLSNVEFRGTDKWSTFEVYAATSSDYVSRNEVKVNIFDKKKPPVALASWSLERFEVTEEMVSLTRSRSKSRSTKTISSRAESKVDDELNKLLNIKPLPLTKALQFNAKVSNLIYAGSLVVTVSGAKEGIYMATRTYNETLVSHPFGIPKSTWNLYGDGTSNGEISGSIFVFALDANNTDIVMDFVMIDGTPFSNSPIFNVTDQIADTDNIVINLGLADRPSVDPDNPTAPPYDKPIELPVVSGEEVFVDDWGNVNIFLK